jgi:amino acid adenylation domain-containing protein
MTETDLPASTIQERMWIHEQMEPGATLYNVPLAWRVEPRFDPDVLGRALDLLVERHELLRTRFRPKDGRLRTTVAVPYPVTVSIVDLSGLPPGEREPEALRQIAEAGQQPFDPATGPLLRVQLVELGGESQILALYLHHLIWDGGTEPLLLAELDRCYQAASRGEAGPAGQPPQYGEFVAAELAAIETTDGTSHEYWLEHLRGAPPFLALSAPARPGPPGTVDLTLPSELLNRLRRVCAAEQVSLHMVAATALAIVLHRWTGQDDLTLGSPLSQRGLTAADDVLGPCLSTIVLRSECPSGTTVGELLVRSRNAVLDAFDHRHVRLDDIVAELNPPRRFGWTPYIDCDLSVEHARPTPAVAGRRLDAIPLDGLGLNYLAKTALTVVLVDARDRLTGSLSYRGDRISRVDAQALARLLTTTLDRLPGCLDARVDSVDLVGDGDLDALLRWERGAAAAPTASVPALLARNIAERPDAIAVEAPSETLTYAQLDVRARELARRLRPARGGSNPVVAVLLGRSTALPMAMLAAWYAHSAVCAIDPTTPPERIRAILDDLDPYAVVLASAATEHLATGRTSLRLDDAGGEDDEDGGAVDDGPDLFSAPESTAYVIFTSGSTGRPKGVAVSHANLAGAARAWAETFGIGVTDRVSQLCQVGFDVAVGELWSTLTMGGVVLPFEESTVAPRLAAWINDVRATVVFMITPLAEAFWSTGAALPTLRRLITGGSALNNPPPADLPYRVLVAYGPTETTIAVTGYEIDLAAPEPLRRIGRPMAGSTVYVVDQAGQRCPAGVVGELLIGGIGVAQGYWHQPELTRERFITTAPDPAAGTVYRSGDRVKWLSDGTLEFLGRVDRQVKRRGYRIEPEELESQIGADALVRHVVVNAAYPAGRSGGEPALVAYLVPAGVPDTPALLNRLRRRLPDYLLPDAIIWLDELPLNANGKVDIAALPPVTRSDLAADTPWAAPTSDLERRIADVWSLVLSVEQVGVDDNFFDLGGNSVLLVGLHGRLQTSLELTLPIQQLFSTPTVRTLAGFLSTGTRSTPPAPEADDLRDRADRRRAALLVRSDRRPRRNQEAE